MRSILNKTGINRLSMARTAVLQVLFAALMTVASVMPAYAAKGAQVQSRPLWLQIYKMIPTDAWVLIAVVAIVAVVWLLFFRRMKDCKCKCGISCKCDCRCSASCPCQIPVLKLKR